MDEKERKITLTLEGGLYNEDDLNKIRLHLDGVRWALSMQELDNYLRGECKYKDLKPDVHLAYEHIRDQIRSILSDNDLTLEMIR